MAPRVGLDSLPLRGFTAPAGDDMGSVTIMSRRAAMEAALRRLAPRMPKHEFGAVIDHALGSPGLRTAAIETAAWLSLVAYVRHVLTDYDGLLSEGYDADSARHFVLDDINAILEEWGARRRVGDQ
jgi:hypothetical protein